MDKWDHRFMKLAWEVGTWSSCVAPNRQMGSIIVRDKRILTTGYNGAPSGVLSCAERGVCMRREMGIPSGTQAQLCYAIHAEQNALIQAARLGVSLLGATLYVTHQPCSICTRLIINAGIARVVYQEDYPDDFTAKLFAESEVKVEKYLSEN